MVAAAEAPGVRAVVVLTAVVVIVLVLEEVEGRRGLLGH